MARFWDPNDGNGKPLTDGRVCLVITSDENPNMPPIRTYGRDKDEVLEKLAKTTETAQSEIDRLRRKPAPPAAPAPARVSADEQARATADLGDPSKSPAAIKTLLRAVGVDVEQIKLDEDKRRVAVIAQEWERQNPQFPHDVRNQRQLINTASLMVGFVNITTDALDAAFQRLVKDGMLFEVAPLAPTVPPDGNRDSRTETIEATTYRASTLRGTPPVVFEKPKYTAAQIDKLTSKELQDKIKNEHGFLALYEKLYAAKSA